jgi:Peptidase family M28
MWWPVCQASTRAALSWCSRIMTRWRRDPGAADNGSGVVTLLETMRALAAGPRPRNDVIALFDNAEEPGFVGSAALLRDRWMKDVRVVVNLDTAVQGPASINQTGPDNGWLVGILARSFTGGAWTSSAGGTYDYEPFRLAGIQGSGPGG